MAFRKRGRRFTSRFGPLLFDTRETKASKTIS